MRPPYYPFLEENAILEVIEAREWGIRAGVGLAGSAYKPCMMPCLSTVYTYRLDQLRVPQMAKTCIFWPLGEHAQKAPNATGSVVFSTRVDAVFAGFASTRSFASPAAHYKTLFFLVFGIFFVSTSLTHLDLTQKPVSFDRGGRKYEEASKSKGRCCVINPGRCRFCEHTFVCIPSRSPHNYVVLFHKSQPFGFYNTSINWESNN